MFHHCFIHRRCMVWTRRVLTVGISQARCCVQTWGGETTAGSRKLIPTVAPATRMRAPATCAQPTPAPPWNPVPALAGTVDTQGPINATQHPHHVASQPPHPSHHPPVRKWKGKRRTQRTTSSLPPTQSPASRMSAPTRKPSHPRLRAGSGHAVRTMHDEASAAML